jgi:ketosteroid isomerase-like protein
MLVAWTVEKTEERNMQRTKILVLLVATLASFSAFADHHGKTAAEVEAAVRAFNAAYAENEVETYFSYYADDVSIYFYGARQDVNAYHDLWAEEVAAGYAVQANELSDLRIQVLADGAVAIASYFVATKSLPVDGEQVSVKAFESDVWEKTEDGWKVVSLHYSEIPQEE